VLNEFPVTQVAHGVQVALGDAYGGEQRRVLAKFHLRPIAAAGTIDVATLTIRWADTAGDVALHTVTVPVVVTAGAGDGGPDAVDPGASPEVTEEVLRLEVAKARREAREAAERGDYAEASGFMRRGALSAQQLPMSEALVHELSLDADRLTAGHWDAGDAKRHMARSRSASKGRRTEYSDDTDQDGTA
jgi:hypothetical protein